MLRVCYVCKIKLRVRLRVATNKNASCAQLRVRREFGLRSCRCGYNWRWKLRLGSNTGVTSIPSNWGHIILDAWKDHDSIVKWCMCDPLEISLLHTCIHFSLNTYCSGQKSIPYSGHSMNFDQFSCEFLLNINVYILNIFIFFSDVMIKNLEEKDGQRQLLYYVSLIRACNKVLYQLVYIGKKVVFLKKNLGI